MQLLRQGLKWVKSLFTFIRRTKNGYDYLYNPINHTYEFTESLELNLVYIFDFEELPPNCQSFVMMKACRAFQNKVEGDDTIYRYTKEEEQEAYRIIILVSFTW